MTINEVKDLLQAKVVAGQTFLSREAQTAFGADSLRDTMAYIKENSVFLTGVTDVQAVSTAEMMSVVCIVYVRGKQPDEESIKLAEDLGIVMLTTNYRMYQSCGILYSNGLGRDEEEMQEQNS